VIGNFEQFTVHKLNNAVGNVAVLALQGFDLLLEGAEAKSAKDFHFLY
jgi:hypothetical protein